jgi:hypothetical protein
MSLPQIKFRHRGACSARLKIPPGFFWKLMRDRLIKEVITAFFLCMFAFGCVSDKTTKDDSIDRLVQSLSKIPFPPNGLSQDIFLPTDASARELVVQATGMRKRASVHVIEVRKVYIHNNEFKAIRFNCQQGNKILLLQNQTADWRYWIYDQ